MGATPARPVRIPATTAQSPLRRHQDVGYEFQLEGARGDHFEMYADSDDARTGWVNTLTHVIAVADARAEFLRNKGVKVTRIEGFQSVRSLEGGIEKTDAAPISPKKQKEKKKKNASAALRVSAGATARHCRAVLCCVVLCRTVLCCVVLCCAVLCCAVLCCVVRVRRLVERTASAQMHA